MDISWPRWRHFPRNKINIQNEIKLNVQSSPTRDPELLPGAAASGYFGTSLPPSPVRPTPRWGAIHQCSTFNFMLIFISFCICCGPCFGPGQLKAAKASSDPDTYPFFTPAPLLLPTNSLGKQESLDWIAVKKRGGHKGYGLARFVSFCEPDLISWNLNRLSNSNSISIIYLMRGSKGAERERERGGHLH